MERLATKKSIQNEFYLSVKVLKAIFRTLAVVFATPFSDARVGSERAERSAFGTLRNYVRCDLGLRSPSLRVLYVPHVPLHRILHVFGHFRRSLIFPLFTPSAQFGTGEPKFVWVFHKPVGLDGCGCLCDLVSLVCIWCDGSLAANRRCFFI